MSTTSSRELTKVVSQQDLTDCIVNAMIIGRWKRAHAARDQKYGFEQFIVLALINQYPGLTRTAIAKFFDFKLTKVCDWMNLFANNLLILANDGRNTPIFLSDRGRAALDELKEIYVGSAAFPYRPADLMVTQSDPLQDSLGQQQEFFHELQRPIM